MLSFTRPSPNTLTVNGLPVYTQSKQWPQPNRPDGSSLKVYTWDVLISKLDVDNVVSWFSGTVSNFTRAVLHIFTVYVHFTGSLNGQPETTVT